MSKPVAFVLMASLFVALSAAADDSRVGSYRESTTVLEVAGEKWAARFASYVDADQKITWSIVVPKNYDPEIPAGVLVYIDPNNSGGVARGWASVLNEKNLIWISANNSGNNVDPRKRIAYALLAPTFVARKYNVDSDRVYLTGLSGGGRVASIVAPSYPTLFKGAIFICGTKPLPPQVAESPGPLQSNRFVFVTGEYDFNRGETKSVHASYVRAGLHNSRYLEFRGMGHQNPDGDGIAQAIEFLDSQ